MKFDSQTVAARAGQIMLAVIFPMITLVCKAQVASEETHPAEVDSTRVITMFAPGDDTITAPPETPRADFSWLKVTFEGHADFLMTDFKGRRVGYDATRDTTYKEIPRCFYGTRAIDVMSWTEASFPDPPYGDYLLTVARTSSSHYTFWTSCYDYSGRNRPINVDFDSIWADSGATHSYTISLGNLPYAPHEVTGGFPGSENESAEIDRMISYVNATDNVTVLPEETESFGLIVVFGAMAVPNTFTATLNGNDVAGLFASADGGHEIVDIPLNSGENVLVLSMDGQTSEGTKKDIDSLTFVVE